MKKDLLHTPEGVRDIYGIECAEKEQVEKKLHDVLNLYGYSDIQTPTFEFFDVFSKDKGSVPTTELFKFFDRYGHTLCLRPDMTPSIARSASKYFDDRSTAVKLCYVENTFVNDSKYYQGRLKENTMAGAELIGDDSTDADAEIVMMTIDCMKAVGLTEFQVELGNVQFFRGLLSEAGISGDDAEELKSLIEEKNLFGVEELLHAHDIGDAITDALNALPTLFGSVDVLERAEKMTDIPECLAAVRRLKDLYTVLSANGYADHVSFDLGDLSSHEYYTGIILHAFTFGTGEPVINGGRYDRLMGQFGSDRASIGFSVNVDRLLSALQRQKIDIPLKRSGILLIYGKEDYQAALFSASHKRAEGERVCMMRRKAGSETADFLAAADEGQYEWIYVCENGKEQHFRAEEIKKGEAGCGI
ncbi:MAG: ATP phosphoribosyltransferase regulatory subunit [Lachnospiraceae bacterium]|jgi:ATP phosphoribosyltransferase regulatory subunit